MPTGETGTSGTDAKAPDLTKDRKAQYTAFVVENFPDSYLLMI